ncbi:MAG: hypothetical protein JKX84_08745 [Flavobacteriales bacterium]|nr:hypothetical protein [Flavobacteriales bacterium]
MSELIFDTKENNNRRREKEFLALSPDKRVEVFLKMVGNSAKFPTKIKRSDKGNFIVEKRKDKSSE